MNRQEEIEGLLHMTERAGMDSLVDWLDYGFYSSPASMRFHGVYPGGLADHSWSVYSKLCTFQADLKLGLEPETIIIAGLLHDVCKVGLYIADGDKYRSNKEHPKGHGQLSVDIIKRFIQLSELEEKMILYHMGVYGLKEFDEKTGEYPLRGGGLANAWANHPAVKVLYFCDELATLEEKAGKA